VTVSVATAATSRTLPSVTIPAAPRVLARAARMSPSVAEPRSPRASMRLALDHGGDQAARRRPNVSQPVTVDRTDIDPTGVALPENLMEAVDAGLRRAVDL
jgi:hypothetical protein